MADEIATDGTMPTRPMSTADLASAGERRPEAAQDPAQSQQAPGAGTGSSAPLLPDNETGDLRRRWDTIQTGFVDEPRRAVEQADQLVAGAMQRLAEVFSSERSQLERQWDRGEDVSTEDLRIALQRYRAFFERLLSI